MPKRVVCHDDRPCFARNNYKYCGLLTSSYAPGKCKFCKPKRDVTNGIEYPYDPNYRGSE